MEWEVSLIEWIQKTLGNLNGSVGKVLSFIGGEMGLLLVLLIVLFCWKKETGKRLAIIITAVNAWLPMLKAAVMRPRPYMEYPDRVQGIADVGNKASLDDVAAQGYSFPSTHSASTVALFIPLANEVKKKRMWILAVVLSFLVGVSRMITGMHYPTDVLAGWVLGLAGAGICLLLEKKVKNEWIRHLILLLVGAFALYFILNTLLKLPFSKEFLAGGTLAAFLVRAARYAVIIFVIIGVYPKVFPLFEKIRKK